MCGREPSGSADPGTGVRRPEWHRPAPREAGFTLLEALVALLVVGLAVGGSLRAASRALRTQGQATRQAEATALAESRLNELDVLPPDSLAGLDPAGWRERALSGRRYRQRSSARRLGGFEHLWHVRTVVAWKEGRVHLSTTFYRPPRGPGQGSRR